jgi:hypothetical protein
MNQNMFHVSLTDVNPTEIDLYLVKAISMDKFVEKVRMIIFGMCTSLEINVKV